MKKYIMTFLVIAGFAMSACSDQPKTESVTKAAETVQNSAKEVKESAAKAAKEVKQKVEKKAAEATTSNDDIRIFQADNSDGKITPDTIQKAFEKAGFYMAANNSMNFPFKRDFNNTYYDVYNLAAFYSVDVVKDFLKDHPTIGLFAPMTMSIYTKKGDKTISIATLNPKRMATITGIPADHPGWKKLDDMIHKALKEAMPNGKFIPYTAKQIDVEGALTVEATMTMEGDDWEDGYEDLQNNFESALTSGGFQMPAFNELSEEVEDSGYDFYVVYSVCKIPVAYTISKNHPEMGAYAPCSMYIYKKEGDKTVHFGIHHVKNWIHSMGLTDKEELAILNGAMDKFKKLLEKVVSTKSE
jgi:uncharacterized protein (DUF302 family)